MRLASRLSMASAAVAVFLHARVEAEERDPHADVGGGQLDGPFVGELRPRRPTCRNRPSFPAS